MVDRQEKKEKNCAVSLLMVVVERQLMMHGVWINCAADDQTPAADDHDQRRYRSFAQQVPPSSDLSAPRTRNRFPSVASKKMEKNEQEGEEGDNKWNADKIFIKKDVYLLQICR